MPLDEQDSEMWAEQRRRATASELCQRDLSRIRDWLPGTCKEPGCAYPTSSKDFKLCVICARKKGLCQMCGLRKN